MLRSRGWMLAMKMVFGIIVIVFAVYLGAELIPAYYENYEFTDFVKTKPPWKPTPASPKTIFAR